MKREIKFKIWDTHCKYFINGLDLSKGEYDDDENTVTYQLDKVMGDRNVEERFIYCQFTGLKDKNGVEIYEGDILKGKKYGKEEIIEVKWSYGFEGDSNPYAGFFFDLDENYDFNYSPIMKNCEVIGNIYQSPNLLK